MLQSFIFFVDFVPFSAKGGTGLCVCPSGQAGFVTKKIYLQQGHRSQRARLRITKNTKENIE